LDVDSRFDLDSQRNFPTERKVVIFDSFQRPWIDANDCRKRFLRFADYGAKIANEQSKNWERRICLN
jgi:hypothetical protein